MWSTELGLSGRSHLMGGRTNERPWKWSGHLRANKRPENNCIRWRKQTDTQTNMVTLWLNWPSRADSVKIQKLINFGPRNPLKSCQGGKLHPCNAEIFLLVYFSSSYIYMFSKSCIPGNTDDFVHCFDSSGFAPINSAQNNNISHSAKTYLHELVWFIYFE